MLDRAHFLPPIGIGEETRTQYQQLCSALDEYIRKTFHEWTQTIDRVSTYWKSLWIIDSENIPRFSSYFSLVNWWIIYFYVRRILRKKGSFGKGIHFRFRRRNFFRDIQWSNCLMLLWQGHRFPGNQPNCILAEIRPIWNFRCQSSIFYSESSGRVY